MALDVREKAEVVELARAIAKEEIAKAFEDLEIVDEVDPSEALAELSVPELRKLAKAREIDLKGLKRKDDIVEAIAAA